MAYYGGAGGFGGFPGGNAYGGFPGGSAFGGSPGGNAYGGFPGGSAFGGSPGGSAFGGFPGGSAFGGFPGGYNVGPGGFSNANLGGAGLPPTLGANLPAVDPNNFAGTVHFGQPMTTYPTGQNSYNVSYGAGGGADFYPGY